MSVSRLTVYKLHKDPSIFNLRLLVFFELGVTGFGQGLMIFHKKNFFTITIKNMTALAPC